MHNHQITVGGAPHAYSDPEETFNVNCNGDFSGDIWVDVKPERVEQHNAHGPSYTVKIPFELMRELVGRWVSDQIVAKLEDEDGRDTLTRLVDL